MLFNHANERLEIAPRIAFVARSYPSSDPGLAPNAAARSRVTARRPGGIFYSNQSSANRMVIEIIIILLLLTANGLFAMSEIAIVTARRVRLEARAEEGDRGAKAALALAQEPTRFLSTIQVGITLVGVVAGAFGGARIAGRLADMLQGISWLAPYADPVAFVLVVTVITYLTLLIGELIPKRVALSRPERVASLVARPMKSLSRVAAPVVGLLTGPTNLVLRLFGIRVSTEPSITAEEIRALIEQGAESGALAPTEHSLMDEVLRLGDRQAGDVMTPRSEVEWIDINSDSETVRRRLVSRPIGPYLVSEGSIENIRGIVHLEDVLAQLLSDFPLDLKAALREPLFVPATTPALEVLSRFQETQHTVGVVVDEYGGLDGLLTEHNLLAAVAGSLNRSDEHAHRPIRRQKDNSWLVDGSVAIDDLETALDVRIPENVRHGARTVGGYIMAALERVPEVGDAVQLDRHVLRVERMDGRRVERVALTRRDA